jgi:hypothetical protein
LVAVAGALAPAAAVILAAAVPVVIFKVAQ